jgi:MFS family permease
VAAAFVIVFVADTVVGMYSPTFSLFAASLGASVTLVGVLSSVKGLTRTLVSVPIGMFSDARGRRVVLLGGLLVLSSSSLAYSFVSNPYALIPLRMLSGLVIASTFFIGMAYMGDIVETGDRGLASGVYTTSMGLGFTVGSALGGTVAETVGYEAMFRVGATVAFFGFLVGLWGLARRSAIPSSSDAPAGSPLTRLGLLFREPQLLVASLGYFLVILMFDATIVSFFPLYAQETLAIGQGAIGSMMAARALVSTSVRLPTGMLTTRLPSRRLMLLALSIGMLVMLGIRLPNDATVMTLVLAGEGICFGMYLTAGQAFVTESFGPSERGAAMGVYATMGALGSTAGPFLMGTVGDLLGLGSIFTFAGVLVLLGIGVILYATARAECRASVAEAGDAGMADVC